MLKTLSLALLITLSIAAEARPRKKVLTLSEVTRTVSKQNYNVYENALKVEQARLNVEVARKNLLPRLNIWSIAGAFLESPFNPSSLVGLVDTVAPFLVPGNWFRAKETKILARAEKEGYRALWANQVHAARELYLKILLDEQLLNHTRASMVELEAIHRIIEAREIFGGVQPGTARDVQIRILGLREDAFSLKSLIDQEKRDLLLALGEDPRTELALTPVREPDFSSFRDLQADRYDNDLVAASPERRQFERLIDVLPQIRKEIRFSFLGISSASRGVAGGIFDGIPIPNGFGFGTSASLKVVAGQERLLQAQKRGVVETLRRQLHGVVSQLKLSSEAYNLMLEKQRLAADSRRAIRTRIELGEDIETVALSEATRLEIQARTAILTLQSQALQSRDRLDRLLMRGDYSKGP